MSHVLWSSEAFSKPTRRCWPILSAVAVLSIVMAREVAAQCPAAPAGARLEITTIPRAAEGGPDETDAIAGTAGGVNAEDARAGIYAHAGDRWWVQPTAAAPLTTIGAEGRWQANIHLGFEYAALLVHKSYTPETQRPALPPVGDCIWAVVTVKGRQAKAAVRPETPAGPGKVIRFSGYDWAVKSGRAGPGPNNFSDGEENVHVDSNGRLHVRITYRDGQWFCAEVVSQKSFGYGTYRFGIASSTDGMDPNTVLGLFTWNDDAAFAHRELDVEISRWGQKANDDAQFVVQPWNEARHIMRFPMPSAAGATHSFSWSPQAAAFESRGLNGALIREGTFTEGIPQAGGENARINLWLLNGKAPEDGKSAEVVLDKFEFTGKQK